MLDFERIFTTLATSLTERPTDEDTLALHTSLSGGIAASTNVITVQRAAPSGQVRLAVAAQSDVFEGDLRKSERATWTADEILSDKYGIREAGSSILEGQLLANARPNDFGTVRLTQKLDLEDGWYSGSAIDTLVGPNGVQPELAAVYTMANNASIRLAGYEGGLAKIVLDGIYPAIKAGSVVVLEAGAATGAFLVFNKVTAPLTMTPEIDVPVDKLTLLGPVDFTTFLPQLTTVYFDPRKVGEIEPIPTKTVVLSDIVGFPRPVTGPGKPALPVTGVDVMIQDAENTTLIAKGDIYTTNDGTTHVLITEIPEQGFEGELVKPITFHWGLSKVTRGETMNREVLGSGNGTQSWQSFKLAKAPLTYVADPDAPGGRRPELAVYVNGRQWRRAQSFYEAKPSDEIYVIKHDASHGTRIIFGDGELGTRVPTGPNNVVARYRHGVGGNKDARTINRLSRPTSGVISVVNPVAASGGEDPPTPQQARERAIQSTRVLGKLVALPDFEVEAARWGGVVAAKAAWEWDRRGDEALVNLWVIAPGPGDPSASLQGYLQALAEPGTHVRVQKAAAHSFVMSFQLELDVGYMLEEVAAAVREHLFDEIHGFFALRNVSIGGVFRRSELYAAIHQVPGVANVRVVSLGSSGSGGQELPVGYAIPKGTYLAPTFISLGANTLL